MSFSDFSNWTVSDGYSDMIWALIGFLIGILISYGFWGKAASISQRLTTSFVTILIVLIIKIMFYTRAEINYLTTEFKSMQQSSCGVQAKTFYDPVFRSIAQHFYRSADEKCLGLRSGAVELKPDEVRTVWSIMLEHSENTFYATNTIAQKDWPKSSCEQQKNAAVRTIKRVMIHRGESNNPFNKSLDSMAKRQLAECKVSEIFAYMKEDLYDNFSAEISILGSMDVVLADGSVVLITSYDEEDKTILKGWVTTDKRKVEAATNLLSKLFKAAKPYK